VTKDEHAEMVRTVELFWEGFADICRGFLESAPPHLRAEYADYLATSAARMTDDRFSVARSEWDK
jgi:hypothetical protein